MGKIESTFIIDQYRSGLDNYIKLTKEIGLWESEKYVFNKYINKTDNILDLGCGTGRTTFALNRLNFTNITGVDITPEMIHKAHELNKDFNTDIKFKIGDATSLKFKDSVFDVVIFSFNGLMSIPGSNHRAFAVKEINRVLKASGVFIFTTHDREEEQQFLKFWSEEKERWQQGKENKKLLEYGDLLTLSKNEKTTIFIHIPDQTEVKTMLNTEGFEVIETFYRSEKFIESELVQSTSGECRFWVCKKPNH